jgi:hypothetical protein
MGVPVGLALPHAVVDAEANAERDREGEGESERLTAPVGEPEGDTVLFGEALCVAHAEEETV